MVHLAAALALGASSLPRLLQVGGLVLVVLSATAALWPRAALTLRLGDDGFLCRVDRAGREEQLRLLPGGVVNGGLVVARLRGDGHSLVLVALADSLPPDQFRALRVWLRWRARFSAAGEPV